MHIYQKKSVRNSEFNFPFALVAVAYFVFLHEKNTVAIDANDYFKVLRGILNYTVI